jgi:hypothetical protein
MHECNAASTGAEPGSLIDQPIAGGPAGGKCGVEIGHAIANVVNPGTAAHEKLRDGAVLLQGSEELYRGFAERQCDNPGAIGDFGRIRLQAEHVTIERERRVEIGHGDSDMGYPGAVRHAITPAEMRSGINT